MIPLVQLGAHLFCHSVIRCFVSIFSRSWSDITFYSSALHKAKLVSLGVWISITKSVKIASWNQTMDVEWKRRRGSPLTPPLMTDLPTACLTIHPFLIFHLYLLTTTPTLCIHLAPGVSLLAKLLFEKKLTSHAHSSCQSTCQEGKEECRVYISLCGMWERYLCACNEMHPNNGRCDATYTSLMV